MSEMRRPTSRLAAALLVGVSLVGCGAAANRPTVRPEPAAKPVAAPPPAATNTPATPAAPRVASGPDFERAQNECINQAIVLAQKKKPQGIATQASLGDYVKCMEDKGYRQAP